MILYEPNEWVNEMAGYYQICNDKSILSLYFIKWMQISHETFNERGTD